MYKAAGPFPDLTKASNQVENVLEARGLGLQLFFKGLLEKNRGQQRTPPHFVFHLVLLLDILNQYSRPVPQAQEPHASLPWWKGVISERHHFKKI